MRLWRAVTIGPAGPELEAWLVDEGLPGWEDLGDVYRFYLSPENAGTEDELHRNVPEGTRWEAADIDEEDWAEGWKQYFKPTRLTARLAVCPTWEEWTPPDGVSVIRMDPGMAFGTGGHQTTRLCMEFVERYLKPSGTLLDVGTGSGILALGGLLLGAGETLCTDNDPLCITVCRQNLALNQVAAEVVQGESFSPVAGRTFDMVVANLVTVALLALAPDIAGVLNDGGVFVGSGTTAERLPEVLQTLQDGGLSVLEARVDGEWAAVAASR
ncbi:MAG TPA: 50S ribosomal protein L11 methyltransferase [Candidatus Xenobia bacterium]|jgi:ribosomal protein L11 methyltransferase